MPTTFEAIYLGVLPLIDTGEGNQNVDQNAVNSWLGLYGGSSKLSDQDNIVEISPGSTGFSGGFSTAYDLDNNASNDAFSVNGGPDQIHDATMVFRATITYGNGTTAQISAVVTQDTDGNAYWVAETSDNADQAAIEAGADNGGIQSLSLNQPIYANGRPGRAYSLTGDRADTDFVPCFTTGMRVDTPSGPVPVEDLVVGDMVNTLDNGPQALRWIGTRQVLAAGTLAPVVFSPNTVGNSRALVVSPQHRILLTRRRAELLFGTREVLVAAKDLVNGDTIYRRVGGEVTYYHLMFDQHQILISDGALSESFYPGRQSLNAMDASVREELFNLFPELRRDPSSYAPAARLGLKSFESRLIS